MSEYGALCQVPSGACGGAAKALDDHPLVLDTVAFAENGRFEEALEVSRRALRLAKQQKLSSEEIQALGDTLSQLEAGHPIRN